MAEALPNYNLGVAFEAIVKRYGEKIALIIDDEKQATYAELNSLANACARRLLAAGVRREDVVAISGSKSAMSYACALAALKCGAIYTFFDPSNPAARLEKIFLTCKPRVVVAEDSLRSTIRATQSSAELEFIASDAAHEILSGGGAAKIDPPDVAAINGSNGAYIMFTSGSTGVPKGALMTHANVLNFIAWCKDTFGIRPGDVLTNVNPLYFDNSVFDIYSALFTGATLVAFSAQEVLDAGALVAKAKKHGCSVWFSVPSLLIYLQGLKALDGRNLSSITRFIFGGEGYPKAKLKEFFARYGERAAFFNVYGPTECTCICSSYKVSAADFTDMENLLPLGKLAAFFDGLIIGEDGMPVAPGEVGELCLLGPNVGLGYYRDPERTAAAFVQNPLNGTSKEMMYKTGDLVKVEQSSGKLLIYGRRDHQIKHQGYRIELEEIESALHRLPYVKEAAAVHSAKDGKSRISAVLVLSEERTDDTIKKDVRSFVPDYMVPTHYVRLDLLPKNQNGKIDRVGLREKYA